MNKHIEFKSTESNAAFVVQRLSW